MMRIRDFLMVSESEGQRLKALIPNGKMLTTSELQQGTPGMPLSAAGIHIVIVMREP